MEFGYDINNNIILMDELFTVDSSRYWIKSTYQDRFNSKLEPEKFDKDIIRDWLNQNVILTKIKFQKYRLI